MATQKPISTISYNSEPFLREQLERWLKAHIIQSYMYICHKGEDGDKDHIHLRIEPNKKLDPMTLSEELHEWVGNHPKPLGVRPWRPSKEEDWILYAVHDERYLRIKYNGGEKGEKLPYRMEDIHVPDTFEGELEIAFIRAQAYLEHTSGNLASKLEQGINPLELVKRGENVFTVNAVARTLFNNDYTRLANECGELRNELQQLYSAIERFGLHVSFDENGNIELKDGSAME